MMSNLTELRHGVELGVINKEMLEKCLSKHAPPGEKGKLFAEESKNFKLVTKLRLDFLNIIKIDYLWMFEALSVLTLTHNKIESIENLSELVNLKELDLSFNEITKIENLDKLINVHVLMLNNNKISVLENLDNLQKMIVLSISGNCITDYKQVTYLRQLKGLKSLSYKGNPCCDVPECYVFLKAVLPNIKYIDYISVNSEEKNNCALKYSTLIDNLDEQDNLKDIVKRNKAEDDAKAKFNDDCFVGKFNDQNTFTKLFETDNEGLVLLNSSEIIIEEQEKYKIKYLEIMDDYERFAHGQYYLRDNEINLFQNEINEMRSSSANKSRMAILNYSNQIDSRAIAKFGLENEENMENYDKFEIGTYSINLVDQLWEDLMSWEMELYEQCTKIRSDFTDNIYRLLQELIFKVRSVFNKWREEDANFINIEKAIFTNMSQEEKNSEVEMLDLLSDPEVLFDIISLSGENHIQFINNNEEALLDKIKEWASNLITNIDKYEEKRNRSRILEIITFIEDQRKEILIH